MFKTLGIVQLAVAPVLVIPAMSGQDRTEAGLDAQLEATLESIEYLGSLRDSARSGDRSALRALERATEAPRDSGPQRSAHMQALSDDIAQLRYSLDKLLEDPSEVAAITAMPPVVVRTLGLVGGAPGTPAAGSPALGAQAGPGAANGTGAVEPGRVAPADRTPGGALALPEGARTMPPSIAGTTPSLPTAAGGLGGTATTGMSDEARRSMEAIVGPLDAVSPSSRRRGTEAVPLEKEGYVADHARLGRLLVRSGRTAEAIELLEGASDGVDARYWLARAYEDADRHAEALELYQAIAADDSAGLVSRHAKHDLEFLEVKRSLGLGR